MNYCYVCCSGTIFLWIPLERSMSLYRIMIVILCCSVPGAAGNREHSDGTSGGYSVGEDSCRGNSCTALGLKMKTHRHTYLRTLSHTVTHTHTHTPHSCNEHQCSEYFMHALFLPWKFSSNYYAFSLEYTCNLSKYKVSNQYKLCKVKVYEKLKYNAYNYIV